MMPASPKLTYADYLALEEKSLDTKHELIDGEITAMAGGTPDHGALAMAFGRLVQNALGDRPCRVYSSDVRVRVRATGMAAYPDLSVVCGRLETDPDDALAIANPVVIVEVLSDSTEARDRGVKETGQRVELVSLGCVVPLDEVYRDPLGASRDVAV
jgi:Uma2 family endonuclease